MRIPWRSAVLALAALALGGCELILGFDPIPDAAIPVVDAPPDAPSDPSEPNDSLDQATPVVPGTYGPYVVFPETDRDYFSFTLDAARDVQIDLLFTVATGDLDMYLYDATSVPPIAASTGFADNEHIARTAVSGGQLPAGTYYILVESFGHRFTNTYSLVLGVQ